MDTCIFHLRKALSLRTLSHQADRPCLKGQHPCHPAQPRVPRTDWDTGPPPHPLGPLWADFPSPEQEPPQHTGAGLCGL